MTKRMTHSKLILFSFILLSNISTSAFAYNCRDVFTSTLNGTQESTGSARNYFVKHEAQIIHLAENAADFLVTGKSNPDIQFLQEIDTLRETFSDEVARDREEAYGNLPDVIDSAKKSTDATKRMFDAIEEMDMDTAEEAMQDLRDASHEMRLREHLDYNARGWSEFADFFEPFVQRLASLKWSQLKPVRRTPELINKIYGERSDYELALVPILSADDPFVGQFLEDVKSSSRFDDVAIAGFSDVSLLYEEDLELPGHHPGYQDILTEVLMAPGLETLGLPISSSNGNIRWFGLRPSSIAYQLEDFITSWATINSYPFGLDYDYEIPPPPPLHIRLDAKYIYFDEADRKKYGLSGNKTRLSDLLKDSHPIDFHIANLLANFSQKQPYSSVVLKEMTVHPGMKTGTVHLKKDGLDIFVTLDARP